MGWAAPSPHRWKKAAAYSGGNLSMGKLPFTPRNVLICGLKHYFTFHHSVIFQCSRNTTACLIAKGTRSLSTFEWFTESQAKMHIHLNWKHFHYNILHFNSNSLFYSNMTACCIFQTTKLTPWKYKRFSKIIRTFNDKNTEKHLKVQSNKRDL